VADAERDFAASVARQLVHGDFWDNNVRFRDGRFGSEVAPAVRELVAAGRGR